jgi:hypothetical protein
MKRHISIIALQGDSSIATLDAKSRRGDHERMTQAVHSVRQGMSEAGNNVSTSQGVLAS